MITIILKVNSKRKFPANIEHCKLPTAKKGQGTLQENTRKYFYEPTYHTDISYIQARENSRRRTTRTPGRTHSRPQKGWAVTTRERADDRSCRTLDRNSIKNQNVGRSSQREHVSRWLICNANIIMFTIELDHIHRSRRTTIAEKD